MENKALMKAFLKACLDCSVISIRDDNGKMTPLVHRTKIKNCIPKICAAIGIEVDTNDVDLLLTPKGTLNELAITSITIANRSILTAIMVIVAIRYQRSSKLPQFATVDWIRRHYREIRSQKHNSSCKPHWAFIDWYELVRVKIFIHVPLPVEEDDT